MPKLRIALISLHTSPFADPGRGDVGGMNVVVKHLSMALAAQGHDVSVFTRRTSPLQPSVEQICPGLALHYLSAGPAELLSKADQVEWIMDFSRALAAFGPWDIIHSHHWLSGLAALPLAEELDIAHVQSYHSIAAAVGAPLSEGEPPESEQRQAAERLLAHHSTALLAISRAEAATIVGRLGGDPQRVHVISPGVELELFRPAASSEPATDGGESAGDGAGAEAWQDHPPYILAAARLEPLKGMELAIEAISLIPPAQRPHLVIAGEATAGMETYAAQLAHLPASLGVEDYVKFVGSLPREEFAQVMRHSELLVVPSYSETYGLVALEAAASGVPTIAYGAGGLVEAVRDGVTGVLLHSRDPQDWADHILQILGDPLLRQQMGQAGRAQAFHMTWDQVARDVTDFYCQTLSRVNSPHNCLV